VAEESCDQKERERDSEKVERDRKRAIYRPGTVEVEKDVVGKRLHASGTVARRLLRKVLRAEPSFECLFGGKARVIEVEGVVAEEKVQPGGRVDGVGVGSEPPGLGDAPGDDHSGGKRHCRDEAGDGRSHLQSAGEGCRAVARGRDRYARSLVHDRPRLADPSAAFLPERACAVSMVSIGAIATQETGRNLLPVRNGGQRASLIAVKAFFDQFAGEESRWSGRTRAYRRLVESSFRFHVPEGSSVLELGCGTGGLLAAVRPARAVGVDVSDEMIEVARRRHPEFELHARAAEDFVVEETFDAIVMSDLVSFADDVLAIFKNCRAMCHDRTRVILHTHSQLWRPLIAFAEFFRIKPRKPSRNWLSPADLRNLLSLADLEVVTSRRRILLPIRIPLLDTFCNGVLANIWPFTQLCVSYWLVARPRLSGRREYRVSVVVPCRDEAGMIDEIVARVPEMGTGTEIVFVEGHSTDGTREAIERAIASSRTRDLKGHVQTGTGKANAVREGFAIARGDLLLILDADLTVSPEDLPKFYDALASGRAELVNGSRLVYDVEPGAMQFLNVVGNKLFSLIFTYLLGQPVKDTLCGTKALLRVDYERIARGRSWFGDFDPFGDFDLLLGAGRLSLKISDLPVRYGRRTYGSTSISRFTHGLLLARMSLIGFRTLRFRPGVPG